MSLKNGINLHDFKRYMIQTTDTFLLLVIYDLKLFREAWHGVSEFLSFQYTQKGTDWLTTHRDILGIFINKSLLPPPNLKLVKSFGLSGVWSLCEVESKTGIESNQHEQLISLMNAFSQERSIKTNDIVKNE